ncbi:MAG: hypothetical protein MZV70_20550 [Desulfobacterales bacterium]|nr:hypothetical protein [Desulfobacterales bacterium]
MAGDLSDLLQCCRELSNILETAGLYAGLSKILVERFGVDTLCIFSFGDDPERFDLAFDHGGGGRAHCIRPNELPFQRELFPNRFPAAPTSAPGPGGVRPTSPTRVFSGWAPCCGCPWSCAARSSACWPWAPVATAGRLRKPIGIS